ncbi:MAG: hypothetical protein LBJ42_02320, partial [Holosporales bacterium]|nr:hypothetical protein [Holosporales bacterium]
MSEAVSRNGKSKGATMAIILLISIVVGLAFPEFGKLMKPASDIFMTLIFIPVIPIIFASVTCTITK